MFDWIQTRITYLQYQTEICGVENIDIPKFSWCQQSSQFADLQTSEIVRKEKQFFLLYLKYRLKF